jgi:hypothetical protein
MKSATTRNKARGDNPSESIQAVTTAMMNMLCVRIVTGTRGSFPADKAAGV